MKKLLLTLGSVASITAPIATTVACSDENEHFSGMGTLSGTELTLVGMEWNSYEDMDEDTTKEEYVGFLNGFAKLLKKDEYKDVTKISTIKTSFEISSYTGMIGPSNPTTLSDITGYDWAAGTVGEGYIASADEVMAEYVFSEFYNSGNGSGGGSGTVTNEDATEVIAALEALNVASTFAGSHLAMNDATNAEEALANFGLTTEEFAKITNVLGTDWELVRLDAAATSESSIWAYFNHVNEEGNLHDVLIPVTWTAASEEA